MCDKKFRVVLCLLGTTPDRPHCFEHSETDSHHSQLGMIRARRSSDLSWCRSPSSSSSLERKVIWTTLLGCRVIRMLTSRLGLCTADHPTRSQLAADMDDNLFANILNNPHHVLHKFLPDKTDHTYNLISRRYSLSLTVKTDCNSFLNRLLLKTFISCILIAMVAFCQLCF